MKELQPLNENVLLEVVKKEEKTAGGIFIPDSVDEKPKYAKVIAIGNIDNPGISVGDNVFYKQFSGIEIEFEGKKVMFIPYGDLLAKIVETESI